jgi:hypothetical protein
LPGLFVVNTWVELPQPLHHLGGLHVLPLQYAPPHPQVEYSQEGLLSTKDQECCG